MCAECGCGLAADPAIVGVPHAHAPGPHHNPNHGSGQDHQHTILTVGRSLLEKNNRLAERNRDFFQAKKLLVLNVVSSPGSGKTTLIRKTASKLAGKLRFGAIVGDLATENDATALRQAGIPVVQITTGTVCHLDAEMVSKAASDLDLDHLDVLVVENVGNLVCPADFDLGESLRVVLLSSPEGEDKPLKYPPLFHSANVAILTKTDLAAASEFDRKQALANLKQISHHAQVFELSAKTEEGIQPWLDFLLAQRAAVK